MVAPSTAGAACPGVAMLGVVACLGGDPGGGGLVVNPAAAAWWWARRWWLSAFFCFFKMFVVRVNRAHGKPDLTSCRERASVTFSLPCTSRNTQQRFFTMWG
jgi:hypothetical protein